MYAGTRQPLTHPDGRVTPLALDVTPLLTGSRGVIVNNVSTMALAPLPLTPAYAISTAAAFENGEEDIFPDPAAQTLAESWRGGAVKALERENAAFVTAEPAVPGAA